LTLEGGEELKIKLKALRINKDMSQAQVAEALGITVRTLQNWESYTTSPTAMQLVKLSELYECGLDNIFLPDELAKSEEVNA
jgi:transcriptional regulator with XRE-family HTH domain